MFISNCGRQVTVVPIILVALSIPCYASSVVGSTLHGASLSPLDSSWIGAFDIGPTGPYVGPDGLDRFVLAQSFTTYRTYSAVTASAMLMPSAGLSTLGGQPFVVSFSLALDNGGQPGASTATADVLITNTAPTVYPILFQNLSLQDDETYWLVASSSLIETGYGSSNCCFGSLPSWVAAWPYSPNAFSQNGGPWIVFNQSFAFEILGTETGDPIPNGNPNPSIVAEPPLLALLTWGMLSFVALTRKAKLTISA